MVLFHVFYMYNGQDIPGALGAFHKNQIQAIFQYIFYSWIMVILFIISGISSRIYLKYLKSYKNFINDRTTKLLIPSTIGVLVFGWAQGYYNMLLSDAFSKMPQNLNKFNLYFIMCLCGCGVLWFNHVFWINSILLIILLKFEKNKIKNFFSC